MEKKKIFKVWHLGKFLACESIKEATDWIRECVEGADPDDNDPWRIEVEEMSRAAYEDLREFDGY